MVNGMTKEMELEKKEEEGLNWADYGFMFLSHWYWFVASVVVAMVIAVYYINEYDTYLYNQYTVAH